MNKNLAQRVINVLKKVHLEESLEYRNECTKLITQLESSQEQMCERCKHYGQQFFTTPCLECNVRFESRFEPK